jgi:hypothetical protein
MSKILNDSIYKKILRYTFRGMLVLQFVFILVDFYKLYSVPKDYIYLPGYYCAIYMLFLVVYTIGNYDRLKEEIKDKNDPFRYLTNEEKGGLNE